MTGRWSRWVMLLLLGLLITGCAVVRLSSASTSGSTLSGNIFLVDPASVQRSVSVPARGVEAPDFTFVAADGTQHRLRDLHGHPLVLNFWATWCPPCRAEMPALNEAYERYRGKGLIVLAVNEMEGREQVARFRQTMGLTLPIVLDKRGIVGRAYRVSGLPTSIFVDARGMVALRWTGMLTEESLGRGLALIMEEE